MSYDRYTGRSLRVREYLAGHPKGATMRELIDAVDPDCQPNQMSGTVCTLMRRNKIRAESDGRCKRYFATATALIDERPRANIVSKRKAKPATRKRRPKPAPSPRPTPAPKPTRAARPGAALRTAINGLAKAPPRTRVAAAVTGNGCETVEQFLRSGGRIEHLPPGASATPLNITLHDINEASMRRRKALLAGEL